MNDNRAAFGSSEFDGKIKQRGRKTNWKNYIGLVVLLNIVALALIPMDLFVIDVPSIWCVIMSGLVLTGDVYICLQVKGHPIKKGFLSLLCVIVIVVVNIAGFCFPYWNSTVFKNDDYESRQYNEVLTKQEAKEDLDVFWRNLNKVHPACYQDGAPEKLKTAYIEAQEKINGSDEIKVYEFARILEKIASQLEDAHTYVKPIYNNAHYSRYNYPHNMAGDRMIKVNGQTLEELLALYKNYYSYESEEWGYIRLRGDLGHLEGLEYLGIDVDKGVTYTFANVKGVTSEEVAYADDYLTYEEQVNIGIVKEMADEEQPFCSYVVDEEKSLAIFTLTECNYTKEFIQCVLDMFTEVKDKNIRNVAVDIRSNGGGSSLVVNEIFEYLDIDSYKECGQSWRCGPFLFEKNSYETKNNKKEDVAFSGQFYLLTSYGSFSSAMFFAEYVKENQVGIIIGESPANDVDGYGDVVHFKLPNSGFFMQVSSKKWKGIHQESMDRFVQPDIKCDAREAVDVLYNIVQ